LLIKAVEYAEKGRALDFGAGGLRDTRYLLSKGFEVTALDAHIVKKIENVNHEICSFEEFNYPIREYTLINGQFAFPFIAKDKFDDVWERLIQSLRVDGILSGNFFGLNNAWAQHTNANILFHKQDQIETLLQRFTILSLVEKEYERPTAMDETKHWHVFEIIAKKELDF